MKIILIFVKKFYSFIKNYVEIFINIQTNYNIIIWFYFLNLIFLNKPTISYTTTITYIFFNYFIFGSQITIA